ncbi:MAG TPA: hypothetical protein VF824_02330 [Thermoanaerobaculia bacterium]|jgi:hypothetical protein
MRACGSDRIRTAGGKVLLHSAIPKGWKARTPATSTHAEFPGSAVLCDDEYYEVIDAAPLPGGGARYVLAPWREEHTIRHFEVYDDAAEERRMADFRLAQKQRRAGVLASMAGMILGLFPSHVQIHLGNELGVMPPRMSLLSTINALLLLGGCVWEYVDAVLDKRPSHVPLLLWLFALMFLVESAIRFLVVMTQHRPIGSLPGTFLYIAVWLCSGMRMLSPFASARGEALFTLPPPEDVAVRDAVQMRGPLFSLLTPAEQARLHERYGYDYRDNSAVIAWIVLVFSAIGAVSSLVRLSDEGSFGAFASLIVAGVLAVEQVIRLGAFRRGPAGSILGGLVRPFVRSYLERG